MLQDRLNSKRYFTTVFETCTISRKYDIAKNKNIGYNTLKQGSY